MGAMLLRTLMIICELGKESGWLDPNKIPVEKIVEEWRSQSSRGRYESAMWKAAGLEEPTVSKVKAGKDWGAAEMEGGESRWTTWRQDASLPIMGASQPHAHAHPSVSCSFMRVEAERGEPAGDEADGA